MQTRAATRNLANELYKEAGPGSEEPGPNEWRRGSRRRGIQVPVDIRIGSDEICGHVRNAGPDSLCVVVRQRLRAGLAVMVRRAYADGAEWSAMRVVHCTDTVGGSKVGLVADNR